MGCLLPMDYHLLYRSLASSIGRMGASPSRCDVEVCGIIERNGGAVLEEPKRGCFGVPNPLMTIGGSSDSIEVPVTKCDRII